jgi:uncharacterized protein YgiM (DUF1202 family)
MKKILAILLCIVLFGALLCGCAIEIEEEHGSIRRKGNAYPDMGISRDGFFYESPDINSKIVNVSVAGQDVKVLDIQEIDDLRWFQTEYGWFCTAIAYSCYTEEFQDTLQVNDEYIAVRNDVTCYQGPGVDFKVKKTLQQGQQLRITETTRNGKWGFSTVYGWIELSNIVLMEKVEKFAVVREGGASIYSAPGQMDYSQTALTVGNRLSVQYCAEVDSVTWWYGGGRWLKGTDVYVEGEMGRRPASGIIIDTTPLNVRSGPTKKYGVVTTMPVGGFASVMEQIDCGGNNGVWGYTGVGWIYMPIVRIESNTYIPVEDTP